MIDPIFYRNLTVKINPVNPQRLRSQRIIAVNQPGMSPKSLTFISKKINLQAYNNCYTIAKNLQ